MLKIWLCPLILATMLLPSLAAGAELHLDRGRLRLRESSEQKWRHVSFCGRGVPRKRSQYSGSREALPACQSNITKSVELLMDSAVWQVYLTQEAERQKKDPEQVAMELINLKQPTEAGNAILLSRPTRRKFPRLTNRSRDRVAQYLIQQQALEERSKLIASIKKEGQYALLIEKPQPPIATIDTDGFPSKGSHACTGGGSRIRRLSVPPLQDRVGNHAAPGKTLWR